LVNHNLQQQHQPNVLKEGKFNFVFVFFEAL
jgi:hypothetical protein